MNALRSSYALLAVLFVALFLVLHALGLRDQVSVLSGTVPSEGFAGVGGLLYVTAWLVAVVAAPIFAIAAAVRASLVALGRGKKA